MGTITKTYWLSLNATNTPSTLIEVVNFNSLIAEYPVVDYELAILLESVRLNLHLKSFANQIFPVFDGDETEAEKLSKYNKAENQSQKIGLRILLKKQGQTAWRQDYEHILTNTGRKNQEDIMPFLSPLTPTRILEASDQIAIQLIDYGNGLLKVDDYVEITIGVSVQTSKKNDLEEFETRINALELLLQKFGAATSITDGTTGLVEGASAGQQAYLLRGDRAWQDPAAFISSSNSGIYGSAEIPNIAKNGWNGIFFAGGGNKNYLIMNPTTGDIGLYNSAIPRWNFYATDTTAAIGLPLSINGLPAIKKIQFLSTIISLPNIVAGGLHQVDVTLSGATVGHYVHVVPIINAVTNGLWTFYIHAQVLTANTISIFFKNDWTGAIDLADFWVRIMYVETA